MKTYYNIMDFGAVSGSNELQTAQIQAAVDAAFLAGGGEVIVPEGIFRTATIRLRSNVVFHMLAGAVLEGSTNPDDYQFRLDDPLQPIDPADGVDTECRLGTFLNPWYRSILWGFQAENIKILGEKDSVIDGKNVFDPQGEEGYRGPHAIQFTYCRNLEFGGYTVKDSANWAHTIHKCDNIFAHDLIVLGGHDGFHVTLAGVLWHQGEGDCSEEKSRSYADRFERVLNALRRDLCLTDVPILIGGLGDYLSRFESVNIRTYYPIVNEQLRHISEVHRDVGFVSAEGLESNPDNLHFNAQSLREFGLRYYAEFIKLENKEKVFQEKPCEDDALRDPALENR